MDVSAKAAQFAQPPQIRLAEKYNLTCDGKTAGFFQWRVTKHAGNPKMNVLWNLSCIMDRQEFKYQKSNIGTVKPCFTPEPYDSLGQLFELGCQDMTIHGMERSIHDGGGCTSMYVQRGEEQGEVFDIDPDDLSIIIPTTEGAVSISSSSSDDGGEADAFSDNDSDAGLGDEEPDDMPAAQPSPYDPDEGVGELASTMGGMMTEQEFPKVPQIIQQQMATLHGVDQCIQMFMFARNYQDVISQVFLTEKKSELFDFINPLSVVTDDKYQGFMHGGYAQVISPIYDDEGKVCGVVQKDPENDPAPCDSEYQLEVSDDKTYWKTIRMICPPKPEIIATAEISVPTGSAVIVGGKRPVERSESLSSPQIKRQKSGL